MLQIFIFVTCHVSIARSFKVVHKVVLELVSTLRATLSSLFLEKLNESRLTRLDLAFYVSFLASFYFEKGAKSNFLAPKCKSMQENENCVHFTIGTFLSILAIAKYHAHYFCACTFNLKQSY